MPIYTGSKKAGTADAGLGTQAQQYPEGASATPFSRLEPLLTVEQLKSRHLKGIPLMLRVKGDDGKPVRFTDAELADYIDQAVTMAEELTHLIIMPTQFQEKLPFSKQDFEAFGYFQLPHKPIASIEALNVTLADNSDVFVFPIEWIETANLIHGQLNIVPLAFQGIEGGTGIIGGGLSAGGGTAVFFNALWNRPWVAALFGITYTAGFRDGLLPKPVNRLIGVIAAMMTLTQIAAAYAHATSVSLGVDGVSQSVGTPGPQRYQVRMEELKAERDELVAKLKKGYGKKIFSTSV